MCFFCRDATKQLTNAMVGEHLFRFTILRYQANTSSIELLSPFHLHPLSQLTFQADLLASAANSFVSPRTDECVAVVGDCIAKEVSLVSAKQVCCQ